MGAFRRLIDRALGSGRPAPALPPGTRAYAIGDIHGRLDLLDTLLTRIDADDHARGGAASELVFLGDYVDRGPDSRGVIERLIALAGTRSTTFLAGNHEEVLLTVAGGDRRAAALFDRIGGRETLLSYGVSRQTYDDAGLADVTTLVTGHVPATHLAWLHALGNAYRLGDYLFAHAGIRPGTPLETQVESDLRWIREAFLDDTRDHGAVIVHGHSIAVEVDVRANRIGIDTGAYATGRLTALGLEGTERWFLQT